MTNKELNRKLAEMIVKAIDAADNTFYDEIEAIEDVLENYVIVSKEESKKKSKLEEVV